MLVVVVTSPEIIERLVEFLTKKQPKRINAVLSVYLTLEERLEKKLSPAVLLLSTAQSQFYSG